MQKSVTTVQKFVTTEEPIKEIKNPTVCIFDGGYLINTKFMLKFVEITDKSSTLDPD